MAAERVAYLRDKVTAFHQWFTDYATPLTGEVSPASRKLIIQAGQLMSLALEILSTAAVVTEGPIPRDIVEHRERPSGTALVH